MCNSGFAEGPKQKKKTKQTNQQIKQMCQQELKAQVPECLVDLNLVITALCNMTVQ